MFPELRGTGGAWRPPGLFGRILATLLTAGAIIIALISSVVVFAIALSIGIVVFGWLWWKMRRVLKQARQNPHLRAYHDAANEAAQPGSNQVIEGEVIRGEWKKERDPR